MNTRLAYPLSCFILILALVNCGGDATAPENTAVHQGLFGLTAVNRVEVPMALTTADELMVEIIEGTLRLETSGEWRESIRLRFVEPNQSYDHVFTDSGVYGVNGSTIIFRSILGPRFEGTLNGEELSYSFSAGGEPVTLDYRRR